MDGIDCGNLIFLLSTLAVPFRSRATRPRLRSVVSFFEFKLFRIWWREIFFFHTFYAFACSILFEEKYRRGAKEEDGKLQDCSLLLGPWISSTFTRPGCFPGMNSLKPRNLLILRNYLQANVLHILLFCICGGRLMISKCPSFACDKLI